ncbi:MAG: glycosyltransferase [Bacteroidales bacterium]|nr:glycosyltransferase [Bacteroidales bacterium]
MSHSFLNEIKENRDHSFYIVLSTMLSKQINMTEYPENFTFYKYSIKPGIIKAITGKNKFLDKLEKNIKPNKVFSVFGPTYWKPTTTHITGFAKPQYIYKDSPYFNLLSLKDRTKLKINEFFHLFNFKHFSDVLITETDDVSSHLKKILPRKNIYTVTNYYNQIFDNPHNWIKDIQLPAFDGITLLMIAANYPHKNLEIIPKVISYLNSNYSSFKFRFVLTINSEELPVKDKSIFEKIVFLGKVNIDQCPYVYQQSDFMFLPTLLECFSASYPEAMRMETPILTSDLPFAHGLCGKSAVYFNPVSAEDIAEKIVSLAKNEEQQIKLIEAGKKQLKSFDSSSERALKYLKIIEESN